MILNCEAETNALGRRLGKLIKAGDKIALAGTLGAGKTSLARGVLQGLGFLGEVPSPSFAIVQQYDPPDVRVPVAHVDFYRLANEREVQELGLDDILPVGAIIAEWPDRMSSSFWDDALQMRLKIMTDDIRQLTWTVGDAWKDRWPPR